MNDVVDPFADDLKGLTPQAAAVVKARKPKISRDEAIELGARLGKQTAQQLGESPGLTAERVARAMAYAAWEWDGKPASSRAQREEFKVGSLGLAGYDDWKKLR